MKVRTRGFQDELDQFSRGFQKEDIGKAGSKAKNARLKSRRLECRRRHGDAYSGPLLGTLVIRTGSTNVGASFIG